MKYVNIRGPTVVRDAASTYIVDKRNSGIRHNSALMWTTVYAEGIISYNKSCIITAGLVVCHDPRIASVRRCTYEFI